LGRACSPVQRRSCRDRERARSQATFRTASRRSDCRSPTTDVR
jgi:hypothetical protein